jgi:hypothetical protein
MTPTPKPLRKMGDDELRTEVVQLPKRIDAAVINRDRLYHKLQKLWAESHLNDHKFQNAYAQAEAAGAEVVWLNKRAVEASRMLKERTSGTLPSP